MNQSFFQKLQRVRPWDFFSVVQFLIAVPAALVVRLFLKDLWVVCDDREQAGDNGYYFFRYVRQQKPQQKIVFAIRKGSPDYERVQSLGPVVSYGSLRHWIYYLAASVNISSQKDGKPNAVLCYLLEVSGLLRNRRAFLQHGIIKDNLPYLHYKKTRMAFFTVSVKREYEYVKKVFGYPEGVVCQVGLCRYDTLVNESDGKTILLMPTWRQWIAHETSCSKRAERVNSFTETNYCQSWLSLLRSEELKELCKAYGKRVIFYPHRNMQKFLPYFSQAAGEHIVIASWTEYEVQTLLKQCSMLVTDYSSVAMDAAYLGKPVVYYQFDYERFRAFHLEEGYFHYEEDAFGPIAAEEAQVLAAIRSYVERDFVPEEKYRKRSDDFFDLRDRKNCERTYVKMKELSNGKH